MKLKNFTKYKKDIELILEFILSELSLSSTDDDVYVKSFLKKLATNDLTTLRLLISLAIDMKSHKKTLASSIAKYNDYLEQTKRLLLCTKNFSVPKTFTKGLPLVFKFWQAVNTIDIRDRTPYIKTGDKSLLCRLLTFDNFMCYLVHANKDINTRKHKLIDYDFNETEKYYQEFQEGKYCELFISKLGSRTGWVFVGERKEIEKHLYDNAIATAKTEDNVVSLIDRLGFYIDNVDTKKKYVMLNYPNDFDETLYQPSTITGDWSVDTIYKFFSGNEFFMPYKHLDFWGRTYSVSGMLLPLKERVHLKFDYLSLKTRKYKFEAVDLGSIKSTSPIKANPESVLNAIIERYSEI